MDVFNLVAGAVSLIAFGFAIWEFQSSRSAAARHRERIAMQQLKNESALRASLLGAQNADLIVQRSKDDDATVEELANLARSTRGVLLVLAAELEGQEKVLKAWKFGQEMTQSELPRKAKDEAREVGGRG